MSGNSEHSNGTVGSTNKKIDFEHLKKFKELGSTETSPLLHVHEDRPPQDVCWSTYIIFFLHGIGHLLPWNFFITATGFFETKFACPSNATHSCHGFKGDFENYFSIAAMLPIVVMTAVNIYLQSKVHYKYRMVSALSALICLFVLTIAFVGINTESWVDGFFGLTLFIIILMNVASAIFQSSTFGFAGVFPSKYTSVTMSGQALAGVFAAIALIGTLGAASDDPIESAFYFFATALVILIVCLVAFFIMMQLKFVKYYLSQTSVKSQQSKQKAIIKESINTMSVKISPPFIMIFRKIWMYALSVYLVFAVTLSLFPAVLSNIHSTVRSPNTSKWTSTYFTPLMCFLMFNCSDFVGRFSTTWITVGSNRFVLFSCSVLRVAFIPLVLLCNVLVENELVENERNHLPVVFNNDAFPIIFTALFGLTNGYFGSVAMISAPGMVPPDQRETASSIMVFFLSSGLLSGSAISFIWTKLVI